MSIHVSGLIILLSLGLVAAQNVGQRFIYLDLLKFSSFSVKMNGFKNNLKSAGKSTTANSTSDMTLMEWSKWISNIFFLLFFINLLLCRSSASCSTNCKNNCKVTG